MPDVGPGHAGRVRRSGRSIAGGARADHLQRPADPAGRGRGAPPMRVGARRLRSDLRTFRPLIESRVGGRAARGASVARRRARRRARPRRDAGAAAREAGELEPDLGPLFEALEERRRQARAALLDGAAERRATSSCSTARSRAAGSPELTAAAERARAAGAAAARAPRVEEARKAAGRSARTAGRGVPPRAGARQAGPVRGRGGGAGAGREAREAGRQVRRAAPPTCRTCSASSRTRSSRARRSSTSPTSIPRPGASTSPRAAWSSASSAARRCEGSAFPSVWKRLDRKKRLRWIRA